MEGYLIRRTTENEDYFIGKYGKTYAPQVYELQVFFRREVFKTPHCADRKIRELRKKDPARYDIYYVRDTLD